jgi:homoserine kinase
LCFVSLESSALLLADEIVVPGSVANLGPGFDTLGVAVELYLRVRVLEVIHDGGARLTVSRSTPPVAGGNALEQAFALAARRCGKAAPSVTVDVRSEIPMAAGLGSSAAASVAGLRVFEQVTEPLPERTLLALAADIEGHADNAAPALCGGLTSVVHEADGPRVLRWRWPDEVRLVVATPATGLATSKARAALPATVSRADAIFNLQRVLALVHALQSADDAALREAVRDRLHQPARAALVPCLADVLALDDEAVLGAFLSGAGPSMALLARRDHSRLEALVASVYERAGCQVAVRTLSVHQLSTAMTGAAVPAPGRTS